MTSEQRRRSWWGWGWEDTALTDGECSSYGELMPGLAPSPRPVPAVASIDLPTPRLGIPNSLGAIASAAPFDRVSHTYGKSYRDVVRALRGDLATPPDVVAYPSSEADVVAILDWAATVDAAVVPYGGGSSVVGGVSCPGDGFGGVVSIDMARLDRVLEIDEVSRAARIQAGALGPSIEEQLRPAGYTLRHFPQSFEFSSLGGWLATRAGGHFATLHTHIDDFVESMRVVTPVGISESWRLPGSGAGPSHDRLFLGSEGTLGIVTEAWMRLQDRPTSRRSATVAFVDGARAFAALRAISQSGMYPANCRLLDPGEAAMSGATNDGSWVLVLGVESGHRPVDHEFEQLIELARDHSGVPSTSDSERPPDRDPAADAWRSSFLRMPYTRDGLARMSAIVETFETAITWDRLEALHHELTVELADVVRRVTGHDGLINCRVTHVYPDGAAPYYTVIAPGRPGSEVEMWDEIKTAAMEILTRHRATVTHHHAVGRDHRPGYDRQRTEVFAAALSAAKHALDPTGILNPGVLLEPRARDGQASTTPP